VRLLVTGGAGFIGSNFIRSILAHRKGTEVVNLDKLTYAGNLENLADVVGHPGYRFIQADIGDARAVQEVLAAGFDAVVNFAAETHVDRSIEDASRFVTTNIVGTHLLLESAREHRVPLFIQISTDEVYGSAAPAQNFREDAPLNPGSPYAASKAAADLLVRSYVNTYGFPAIVLRCTNNYGPYQFPEKFIPLMIANALEDKPLPVYGDGLHERDWLYVEDYCLLIELVLERGKPGEIYNASSGRQMPNRRAAERILELLGKPSSLIRSVEDRRGHDRRYAIDSTKSGLAFGWEPRVTFEEGIRRTIDWYKTNTAWLKRDLSKQHREDDHGGYSTRSKTPKSVLRGAR